MVCIVVCLYMEEFCVEVLFMFVFDWFVDFIVWVGFFILVVLEIVLGIDNLVFVVIFVDKLLFSYCDCVCISGLVIVLFM